MPGQPPCPIATFQEAVLAFGDDPTFQSVGRKGSQLVLAEMGNNCGHGHLHAYLHAPEQIALLKTLPNRQLAAQKSQILIQELFEDRGHFFLIGVASHAELASKEHGWERLKRKLKPEVDGTPPTLQRLIHEALPTITQRERLLDNARCWLVMHAYRALAERGGTAIDDKIELPAGPGPPQPGPGGGAARAEGSGLSYSRMCARTAAASRPASARGVQWRAPGLLLAAAGACGGAGGANCNRRPLGWGTRLFFALWAAIELQATHDQTVETSDPRARGQISGINPLLYPYSYCQGPRAFVLPKK